MNIVLNSVFIDIIITFIMVVMLIFGYFKGFVYRAYDLIATVISLLLALYASSPLSNIYVVYEVSGLGEIIGEIVNRFIIFVILFIGLKLILLLIGKFVKPLLKKVVCMFSLFKYLDHLLGVVASFVEGMIIIYMVLIFIVMPIVPNGKDNIEDTVIAKKILELVPSFAEEVEAIGTLNQLISDGISYESLNADNIYAVSLSLNQAYEKGIISQGDLEDTLLKYYQDIEKVEGPISLNQKQYDEVNKLLLKVDSSKIDINKILSKIIVSE